MTDLLERRKVGEVRDRRRSLPESSRFSWRPKFDFVVTMRINMRVAVIVPTCRVEAEQGYSRMSRLAKRLQQTSITHVAILISAVSSHIDFARIIAVREGLALP